MGELMKQVKDQVKYRTQDDMDKYTLIESLAGFAAVWFKTTIAWVAFKYLDEYGANPFFKWMVVITGVLFVFQNVVLEFAKSLRNEEKDKISKKVEEKVEV